MSQSSAVAAVTGNNASGAQPDDSSAAHERVARAMPPTSTDATIAEWDLRALSSVARKVPIANSSPADRHGIRQQPDASAGGDTDSVDGGALIDQVRSAYDAVASEYASRFPTTEPEQPVDLAMIDHFIAQLGGGTREVLDAGCGTGRMSRYLTDRGCTTHGVDLSPGMIAMAHRDHPDLRAGVASIVDLPFPDARFDGVVYWYSIIHVPDADLPVVFREARRVLRPGGVMLVAFQTGDGVSDVGTVYRRLGYAVTLTRFDRSAEQISRHLALAGCTEEARLVRRPVAEQSGQAFLIVRASPAPPVR